MALTTKCQVCGYVYTASTCPRCAAEGRTSICPKCKGTGEAVDMFGPKYRCTMCNGSGRI